jgi:hypothetical protein
MAFEIPWVEPETVRQGDRIQWKRSLADYPATTWTLTYYFRTNLPTASPIDVVASTLGSDYSIDISPTASRDYLPGVWFWDAYVATTGDRKTVAAGQLLVTPDFSQIDVPYDGRTQAKRILESINLVIEGRASTDVLRYVMQAVGRSVDKLPISDLLKFRDYWIAEVKAEENAGTSKGKNVLIRFNL